MLGRSPRFNPNIDKNKNGNYSAQDVQDALYIDKRQFSRIISKIKKLYPALDFDKFKKGGRYSFSPILFKLILVLFEGIADHPAYINGNIRQKTTDKDHIIYENTLIQQLYKYFSSEKEVMEILENKPVFARSLSIYYGMMGYELKLREILEHIALIPDSKRVVDEYKKFDENIEKMRIEVEKIVVDGLIHSSEEEKKIVVNESIKKFPPNQIRHYFRRKRLDNLLIETIMNTATDVDYWEREKQQCLVIPGMWDRVTKASLRYYKTNKPITYKECFEEYKAEIMRKMNINDPRNAHMEEEFKKMELEAIEKDKEMEYLEENFYDIFCNIPENLSQEEREKFIEEERIAWERQTTEESNKNKNAHKSFGNIYKYGDRENEYIVIEIRR